MRGILTATTVFPILMTANETENRQTSSFEFATDSGVKGSATYAEADAQRGDSYRLCTLLFRGWSK